MPEAKIKPWSTQYMDTYRRTRVPKPPTYKRGSNYNRKHIVLNKNCINNSRPSTADSIDSSRRYHGTHMIFSTDAGEQADEIPLDMTITGAQIPLASRNNNSPDYMKPVEESISGIDGIQQYSDAELEAIPKAPTPVQNSASKADYHWSVWPQPADKRVETPVARPQSAFARYPEDQHQNLPRPVTPVNNPSNKQQDYHWSVWPQPPEKRSESPTRPHTALGIYNEGHTCEDLGVSYNFGSNEDLNCHPTLTYVPELQSWITASNDYEKDIATKINSMYLSQTPRAPPEYLRPKREGTFTYGYGQRIAPMRAAPGHYAQSWFPYTHNSLPEDMIVKGMAKRIENCDPIPGGLYRSNTDISPLNRRSIRYPRSEDYIHQHSMFMSTQPLVRGHFIIHPDWVSERMSKKKINTIYGRKKSGLRYGTN